MTDSIKLIAENGVLVVIAGMVLYFAFKLGNVYLSKISVAQDTNLNNHGLFVYLKSCLKFGIENFNINNEDKKLLYRVMMKIKMQTIENKCKEFIREVQLEKFSDKDLKAVNIQLLTDIVEGYETGWRKIGVPDFIISIFRKWHMPRITGVIDATEHICDSHFFPTQTSKQASIFYSYYNGVHVAMIDGHASFNEMNGHVEDWARENPDVISKLSQYDKN